MDSTLIVFTKVPIPGLVKTRLTQDTCLTELDSAKIAEAMLKDTICLGSRTIVDRILIGYFPDEGLSKVNEIIDCVRSEGYLNKPIDLILQKGSNFDQRFEFVVNQSFRKDSNFTVVLGSDLPFLDPEIINIALRNLIKNINGNPIIIGPSSGGGIYLVGISNKFNPSCFSDHNLFSGGLELSNFASFSKNNKFRLISLPPYGDIDIEEDLVSLISYIQIFENSEKTIGFHFPHYTNKILNELGLYIIEQRDQTRRRKLAKKNHS